MELSVGMELPVGQYELPVSWYELPVGMEFTGWLVQKYRLVSRNYRLVWNYRLVDMNYRLVQKYRLVSMELPVGMELPVVLAIDRELPDVG